ncbi:hypothetical protein PIB30_010063 [Stylosanthes scabra]|uniref:Uncharacterized protein n=1 Tax=Stylosanthes scabra TaxID=79078 RepID=A0ABU6X5F9_9FABA|nr:hypothetical protein [Stylosanthes scabra]
MPLGSAITLHCRSQFRKKVFGGGGGGLRSDPATVREAWVSGRAAVQSTEGEDARGIAAVCAVGRGALILAMLLFASVFGSSKGVLSFVCIGSELQLTFLLDDLGMLSCMLCWFSL